jgi:hypothetical protein
MVTRLFFIVVAGIAFSGCATGATTGTSQPTYLTAAQTDVEYLEASKDLVLPSGFDFPAPNNAAVADDGNKIYYEAGSGLIDAQYQWYCAWAAEATRAADPGPALDHMAGVESLELWDALDEVGRAQFSNQVSFATLGDVGMLRSFVDTNCSSAAR